MAYMSNGSEGMDYEARFCQNCVHFGPEEGPGCPILLLHMLWNYDQCQKTEVGKVKEAALDNFIPRSADGLDNEQCKMFVPLEHLTEAGKNALEFPDRAAEEKRKLEEHERIYGKRTEELGPGVGYPAELDFGIEK